MKKWYNLFCTLLLSFMQIFTILAQSTIEGTVTDNKNEPAIGATITLEGTTMGSVTDDNGKFFIKMYPQKHIC